MLDNAIQYIEKSFGVYVYKHEFFNTDKLPIYLSKSYNYQQVEILNKTFLLLSRRNDDFLSIDTIENHVDSIRKKTEINYSIIFVFKEMNSYYRRTFIKEQIQFIIPGKMIYIFELGTIFNERHNKKYINNYTHYEYQRMSPSTQALFMHLMTTNDFYSSMEKIANKLKISKMSVSRGYSDLINLNLIEKSIFNESIEYSFKKDKMKIWEDAQLYLVNPLFKTIRLHPESINRRLEKFILSGETALSYYSLLMEPKNKIYGITKKDFNKIELDDNELNIYDDNYVIVQLFLHSLPTKNNILHPLSLALLLKDEQDPRIKIELRNLIDNYFKTKDVNNEYK